jgi:hypothetical protein
MQNGTRLMNVPELDISQAAAYERFAYALNETHVGSQQYLGDRSIIERLAVASAATGRILALPPLFTNATCRQTFTAPYTQCQKASAAVAAQIDIVADKSRQALDVSTQQVSLDYFAVVPALSILKEGSLSNVQIGNLNSFDAALDASNQLWLYFTRYKATRNFTGTPQGHYVSCQLYNASYQVEFSWSNGIQQLKILSLGVLNQVYYPANTSTSAGLQLGLHQQK